MNLAISNLAWDYNESNFFFKYFKEMGVDKIESTLTKIKNWENLNDYDVLEFKEKLDVFNINSYSIQSLFFNTPFKNLKDIKLILEHFKKIIHFSKLLDSKILVFGSPKLRVKYEGFDNDLKIIFKELDYLLGEKNINLMIEPNSKKYGGEFFFNINEIINFIEENDLKNISTMIDTHNLILEGLSPFEEYLKYCKFIKHIHVSEDELKGFQINDSHIKFSELLQNKKYEGVITYEVLKFKGIEESITNFNKIYGYYI